MKKATKKKIAVKKSEYVIVRCTQAGVHAGYLSKENATHLTLTKARRIWYWNGAASLNELAVYGLNPKATGSKIGVPVASVRLLQSDACEVIVCQPEGKACIEGYTPWRA